jgi:periplasmic divalent cation tolerance protein
MKNFVIVLTTLPGNADIESFAHALVDEHLAACVNILPRMQSIYRWEGVVEHAEERQAVVKTTRDRVEQLKARLADLHPYEVPEILVIPIVDGGETYLDWISESTSESSRSI